MCIRDRSGIGLVLVGCGEVGRSAIDQAGRRQQVVGDGLGRDDSGARISGGDGVFGDGDGVGTAAEFGGVGPVVLGVGRVDARQPVGDRRGHRLGHVQVVEDVLVGRVPVRGAEQRVGIDVFDQMCIRDSCRGADAIAISEHAIATGYPGASVIATEPVAYYLLAASGLVNRTPASFTAANENETDPAPSDMAAVLDLINHRQVSALLVNPQTSTPAIDGLQDAARRAGVPVTMVTETLPSGTDYLTWQRDTVNQLLAALRSSR